jgi:hypothetical protein
LALLPFVPYSVNTSYLGAYGGGGYGWDNGGWGGCDWGKDCLPVPIPSTILLFGSGLVGLVGIRKKFKN